MAVSLPAGNQTALYFSERRIPMARPPTRSVVELSHGGDCTLAGEHLFQGAHRDDERDIGLPVAGHVRAAVSERRRVDGELEGTSSIASADVTNQDVVVQVFGLLCSFRFLHVFTSPEALVPQEPKHSPQQI